jgi:hypothetical protein
MIRLLLMATLGLVGCLPSVEETCKEIAETHCERCYTCSQDFNGSTLCGVDGNQNQCISTLSQRCETQAATVEASKDALDDCLDQVESSQCESLLQDFAAGADSVPDSCGYYL